MAASTAVQLAQQPLEPTHGEILTQPSQIAHSVRLPVQLAVSCKHLWKSNHASTGGQPGIIELAQQRLKRRTHAHEEHAERQPTA